MQCLQGLSLLWEGKSVSLKPTEELGWEIKPTPAPQCLWDEGAAAKHPQLGACLAQGRLQN